MCMLSYVFPIYPNREQVLRLESAFEACRFTYNALLEELQKSSEIDRSAVQHRILELKERNPPLREVYSKTLQYECHRLFSNLTSLTRLKRNGRKVGKLRFKGKEWFKTIVYNPPGFGLAMRTEKRGTLGLSKIGRIRIKAYREIVGRVRQVVIKRSGRRWYAILQTDGERNDLHHGDGKVGIDLGIENYMTDSRGDKTENPRTLDRYLERVRDAHRELSRTKRGSRNHDKARVRLRNLHLKVRNVRTDFLHKQTTVLVRRNRFIAVENLNIKSMMEEPRRNARNIADASWDKFLQMLRYKAASAGCGVAEVDPRGTTLTCSRCGSVKDTMPLHVRIYVCNACGMTLDRDYNAAINILKRASGGQGLASGEGGKGHPMRQEAAGFSPR